ncbi:hypothetical protein L345_14678, partial [Ophiophagus hannah]
MDGMGIRFSYPINASSSFVHTSSTYLYSEVIEPLQLETSSLYNSRDNCYYSGYVEGVPDSQVILSTCSGLWGHIQCGTLTYEIQPVENSSTFQHLIYRRDLEAREPCMEISQDGADGPGRETRMVRTEEDPDLSTRQYVRYSLRHREHFDHAGLMTATGNLPGLSWGERFCHPSHVSVSVIQVFSMKECGNGVIDDEEEECDCGVEAVRHPDQLAQGVLPPKISWMIT